MIRLCYDSITASDIPVGVTFVAGYINGTYKWSDADWALHPDSIQVRIAVSADCDDGHVLDVEKGDATPEQAPGWVLMRRAAGMDPTVYCGLYEWAAVRGAFQEAGVAEPYYWIAHYDNYPAPQRGALAKQYANATFTHGHYDASVVDGFWPGVEEEDMALREEFEEYKKTTDATIEAMKSTYNPLYHHIHLIHDQSFKTTEPLVPPVEGAVYAGESADDKEILWRYPDGHTGE